MNTQLKQIISNQREREYAEMTKSESEMKLIDNEIEMFSKVDDEFWNTIKEKFNISDDKIEEIKEKAILKERKVSKKDKSKIEKLKKENKKIKKKDFNS